jgi:hypothetical protein
MVVRLSEKISKRGKTTKNVGWDEILMIILISSKKLGGYKIMRNTVYGDQVDKKWKSGQKFCFSISFFINIQLYCLMANFTAKLNIDMHLQGAS